MSNRLWDKNEEKFIASVSGTHGEDVSARVSTRRYYNSRDREQTYSWKSSYACLANTVVFYLKNTDSENDIIIDSIQAESTVDCEFIVCLVTGTAAGGSAVTAVNWSAGSSNTAGCTALEGGITGLTSSGDIGDIDVLAGKREVLSLEGAVRIPNGYALAIMCNKAGTIHLNIFGEFE